MQRRKLWIAAGGAVLALIASVKSREGIAQPSYRISREQLQQVLAERFPLRYAAQGLLELRITEPALRLLPERNRIACELPIEVSGPALDRTYNGAIALDFALRYEAGDRTLRAHQIRVRAVHVQGLARDAAMLIDAYARSASERALLEVVVHRLRPGDLALAETMGFEPGEITVEPGGLAIRFVPRALR
jgi:hypothetical protein